MTYLEIVNKVLRRLRENEVSSVQETPYSRLIGDLINVVKREVEDAWNWSALRDTIIATTVADTRAYVLTNARDRFRVLDVYNDSANYILKPIYQEDQTINLIGGGNQTGKPIYYSFNGIYNGDPVIDLYPIPDSVYAINFNLVIPQDDFTLPGEVLLVPYQPVILNAYMKALVERGEDGSTQYQWAAKMYGEALSTAIAQDEARLPGETYFYAV